MCVAPDTVHRTSGRSFPISQCASCGLGRTEFGPDVPDPSAIYPLDYVYHDTSRFSRGGGSRRRSESAARAIGSLGYWRWCDPRYADLEELSSNPGIVLDVGCGAGRYLRRFSELDWKVEGIEPSASAAEVARRQGFTVQTGRAEDATYPLDTYDLVTMYHSLEHCDRPRLVAERAVSSVKHGAVIAIALCNFDSPGRRFFGAAWPLLEIPRHRYHYTPEALALLLGHAGAVLEDVYYHNDLGDIPTALGHLARLRHRLNERSLRSERADGSGPGPAGASLRRQAGRLLTMAYGPQLRRVGLSMRTSFLARFRRP